MKHEYEMLRTEFRAHPVVFNGCYTGHKRFKNVCSLNSKAPKKLLQKHHNISKRSQSGV